MKFPGAQTGTYQQSLNRIVTYHRNELMKIPAGQELPNQRVKALKALLWVERIYLTARMAEELLSLHGIMEWTRNEIVQRAKLRKARQT